MSDQKNDSKLRRERVLDKPKNGYDRLSKDDVSELERLSLSYRKFIDYGKTERECVNYAIRLAEAKGFKPYTRGMAIEPGDKLYLNNRGKALILAVVGKRSLSEGVNIVAAHVDAPRLDLKTNPLYEETEIAFFKTHYYGGIKKYQWLAIPLELRGVIALKDGSVVNVSVGADPDDPVFCITDLLPHLANDQYKKTLADAVPGESLNILLGVTPAPDDDGDNRVKLNIMEILNEKYGITEADLHSAELSLVPAFSSRDVGFDRSLIGAYGHDDRVCGYTALEALLQTNQPEKTAVCVLADKEEIGSEGVTGMRSQHFDTFIADLCAAQGVDLRVCFESSFCMSADVAVAFDPNYGEVYDSKNTARLTYGVGICKYTGSRGKSGASDASAETVAKVRKLFDDAGVLWQMAPLGKVDQGGGGTVAMFMANRNIETIDVGVPVLSMHSPFEVVSKLDTYMTFKGLLAFYMSK